MSSHTNEEPKRTNMKPSPFSGFKKLIETQKSLDRQQKFEAAFPPLTNNDKNCGSNIDAEKVPTASDWNKPKNPGAPVPKISKVADPINNKNENEQKRKNQTRGKNGKIVPETVGPESGRIVLSYVTPDKPRGTVTYDPFFLDKEEADQLFAHLQKDIPWREVYMPPRPSSRNPPSNTNPSTVSEPDPYKNDKKGYKLPRLQCWFSDENVVAQLYQKEPALPWSPLVLRIKRRLEDEIQKVVPGTTYNYCLLNRYDSGYNKIGAHGDDEAVDEGKNVVASISVGATRSFIISPGPKLKKAAKWNPYNDDQKNYPTRTFMLGHGSLCVMYDIQTEWKHEIPEEPHVKTCRINLTFRHS